MSLNLTVKSEMSVFTSTPILHIFYNNLIFILNTNLIFILNTNSNLLCFTVTLLIHVIPPSHCWIKILVTEYWNGKWLVNGLYIYIYVCICVCEYVGVHMCGYVCVCPSVCMGAKVCGCACVYCMGMRVCRHICGYACVCVIILP